MDEDDNGKFRLERVKAHYMYIINFHPPPLKLGENY